MDSSSPVPVPSDRAVRGVQGRSASSGRHDSWCFTSFADVPAPFWSHADDRPSSDPGYSGADPTELVFQRELCPDTGREHWQGYIHFAGRISFKRVCAWFGDPRPHLEPRRGSPSQARSYAAKEETRLPGTEPVVFGCSLSQKQGTRSDLQAAYEYIRQHGGSAERVPDAGGLGRVPSESAFADSFPRVWARYPHLYARVLSLADRPRIADLPRRVCSYFFGPTGSGKSYSAREALEELNVDYFDKSPGSHWFDGYTGQSCVLFDDFRGSWMPYSLFLRVTDPAGYWVQVQTKGGHVMWKPVHVFVTSNVPIHKLYPNHDPAPLLRRFAGKYFQKLSRQDALEPYVSPPVLPSSGFPNQFSQWRA